MDAENSSDSSSLNSQREENMPVIHLDVENKIFKEGKKVESPNDFISSPSMKSKNTGFLSRRGSVAKMQEL